MRRREFIALLGGAAAWPPAAPAQQPTVPAIGFLDTRSPEMVTDRLVAFRRGLKEAGYVEGENVAIVYRWAENRLDRLPALAAELVHRQVALIAVTNPSSATAANAATTSIPIVFLVAEDPVRLGLVASLARPGGHNTGINFLNVELSAKRLDLLHQLVPGAARVAVLVNPTNPTTERILRDVGVAGPSIGVQIQAFHVSTGRQIDETFTSFLSERPDAIFVGLDQFLVSRRVQLVNLAARYAIPATFPTREFTEIGGLMSYGTDLLDAYRQLGIYCGRILNGMNPADLPVMQSSKFELVINSQTARMLGLTVPPTLLAVADEVIE
jgi:putative tryptophan/tyrosine transport system substrate-binding protein